MNFNKDIILSLEEKHRVEYPLIKNATYKSLVNYATDLKTPIQRWYRYKEGYSVNLMDILFQEYGVKKGDIVLDPFCGSGSTIVQGKISGVQCYGFEINPFSSFLAKVKTQNYRNKDIIDFKIESEKILNSDLLKLNPNKPELSTIDKLYPKDVLKYLLNFRDKLNKIENKKVKDLLFLAWLGSLEEVSNYRKAGNGLKVRKGKNFKTASLEETKKYLKKRIDEITEDLPFAVDISKGLKEPKIYEKSSLDMSRIIDSNSIKGVLFSPPYANCFDYTEIYKIELWMGGFVNKYEDLKKLRERGVRSHLNGYKVEENPKASKVKELNILIEQLEKTELWDKRIPKMVRAYFNDMFKSLEEIYKVLKPGGFCAIVVSNSAYGGVIVPTDLLLAEYAKKIGFKELKIDVARFIITSSQQYNKTKKYRKYLRESIIHIQK